MRPRSLQVAAAANSKWVTALRLWPAVLRPLTALKTLRPDGEAATDLRAWSRLSSGDAGGISKWAASDGWAWGPSTISRIQPSRLNPRERLGSEPAAKKSVRRREAPSPVSSSEAWPPPTAE